MSILAKKFRTFRTISIFLLFFTASEIIATELYSKEKVIFIIDCWRYNFGWETFGGGYIRHFLVFTEDKIIDIKTDQISYTPAYSYSYFDLSKYSDKSLYESLFFATLEAIITVGLEKILGGSLQERVEKEFKNILLSLDKEFTVESLIKFFETYKIKTKVKNVFLIRNLKLPKVKIKNDNIVFSFAYMDKKYKFIAKNKDKNLREEIVKIITNLIEQKEQQVIVENVTNLQSYIEQKEKLKTFTKNSIFFEFSKKGLIFSFLNYDYRFKPYLSLRIGVGYLYTSILSLNFITFPNSSNHIEVSAGFCILPFDILASLLSVGYRFQPYKKDGVILRVNIEFSPEINLITGGLSIGYCW
ncbi:MAG: hypothetical protein ABDH23_05655 [Endomicrobiia bacterium]